MGWPPAVIIVVRHGARLDAADKQWHLTSPTPYDPPLTYGGWTQSRALGARIANILRTRETDDEIPVAGRAEYGSATRKRRHKVIIHSSPFLRCVQTSVAISAGLAQNPGHLRTRSAGSPLVKAATMSSSPRMRPLVMTGSPRLAPIPEPGTQSKTNGKASQPDNIKKSTVRVDAFLGEWLTPDYFELITPPPSYVMMVAGAKADLLRREDYSNLMHAPDVKATQGFPGGWGSPTIAPKENDDNSLSGLPSLGANLPRRDRTSSLSSVGMARSPNSGLMIKVNAPAEHGVYMPPVPSYAISTSDPIPPGYVAHSRDACVDVDYQWDSMREPQNWGTGGEYGEEWSQMHKRFRSGIQSLLDWYITADDPGRLLTKVPKSPTHPGMTEEEEEEEDEDTDLVIILVTHGAGCNALIGALTNQPVLLDVGMASLTMAVRKPIPADSPISSPPSSPVRSRRGSRIITIADQYDVKLVANTDHLRANTSSTPSRQSSLSGAPMFRERFVSPGSFDGAGYPPGPRTGVTIPSSIGSIRRTASVASGTPRSYAPARQSSIGLWSAPAPEPEEEYDHAPEDDMILNFGNDGASDPKLQEQKEDASVELLNEKMATHAVDEKEDDVAPLGGLWGAPRPPGYTEKIREFGPKRRWTVNERDRL